MAATLTFTAADLASVPTYRGRASRPAPSLASRLNGISGAAQLLVTFQQAQSMERSRTIVDLVSAEQRVPVAV